jgi:hypothetical protein
MRSTPSSQRPGSPAWGTGFPCLSEVEATDYGMREFAATDPDGNLLRVGHVVVGPRHPAS